VTPSTLRDIGLQGKDKPNNPNLTVSISYLTRTVKKSKNPYF